MEHIANMEYSLWAIRDIIEFQIAENVNFEAIWYRSEYPFCKEAEYRLEVSEYLVKFNNDNLKSKLNRHLSVSETIIQKWEDVLKKIDNSQIEFLSEYDGCSFYCRLLKTINPPTFENCVTKHRTDVHLFNPFDEKYKLTYNSLLVNIARNARSFLLANINNEIEQESNSKNSKSSTRGTIKPFGDYLTCNRKDQSQFIESLKPIFSGRKGKQVAIILLALKEAKLIAFSDGERTALYNAMGIFGDIGTPQSIDDFFNTSKLSQSDRDSGKITNKLYYKDIEPFIEQMKSL